jgi:hypothetical protein
MATTEHFDPDLMAAFIDGRLSGAERERVVRLLAESEEAFEVYSDAVMARRDLEDDPAVSLAAHRERRSRRWWIAGIPAAAAAALVVALFPAVQARRADATLAMRAESITQPLTSRPQLAVALGTTWDEGRWSVNRGGGSTVVDSTAALRLGVRATDLQVALAVGDRERAGRVAADMVAQLGSVNLSDAMVAEYGDLQKRITNGDSIGAIIGAASTADDDLRAFLDSGWYGVGKWLAAGELAARTHSADFFEASETTRFLAAAILGGGFAPDEVAALRRVEGVVTRGVAENDFEMIRETFATLIRRHAGRVAVDAR